MIQNKKPIKKLAIIGGLLALIGFCPDGSDSIESPRHSRDKAIEDPRFYRDFAFSGWLLKIWV